MTRLEWNLPKDQIFEAGLDRGVLYVEDGPAVPWNGLISVKDSGKSDLKNFYLDGVKYLSTASTRQWEGSLSAYTYPEEFASLIGIAELGDGFYADSQAAGRFGLSYRTMINTPGLSEKPGYKIHLIYKVMASLSDISHDTLNGGVIDPNQFDFDLSAVPILVPGFKPTSHFIIDTRKIDEDKLNALENLIYGNFSGSPTLPDIDDLIDLLSFDDEVVVVYNGDGTWTATGSNSNITMFEFGKTFRIDNVDATYLDAEIYEFDGLDTGDSISMLVDEDGTPYAGSAGGSSSVGIGEDTDDVPYFGEGVSGLQLQQDTDGVYYFED